MRLLQGLLVCVNVAGRRLTRLRLGCVLSSFCSCCHILASTRTAIVGRVHPACRLGSLAPWPSGVSVFGDEVVVVVIVARRRHQEGASRSRRDILATAALCASPLPLCVFERHGPVLVFAVVILARRFFGGIAAVVVRIRSRLPFVLIRAAAILDRVGIRDAADARRIPLCRCCACFRADSTRTATHVSCLQVAFWSASVRRIGWAQGSALEHHAVPLSILLRPRR